MVLSDKEKRGVGEWRIPQTLSSFILICPESQVKFCVSFLPLTTNVLSDDNTLDADSSFTLFFFFLAVF